jgi:uncharacterized SAM-binding protein YcdF (DUF218 family)
VLLVAALGAGAYRNHTAWLGWIGGYLVQTDPAQSADIVVVLAGDRYCDRVMKGAELAQQGLAPDVLVNGLGDFYGVSEAVLAVDFAVRKGVPRKTLEPFLLRGNSTIEEAQQVDAELRRRGVRKALVVTSDYHTRRARSIFANHTSGEIEYFIVASRTEGFSPDGWWRSRQGKKTLLLEYIKTFNSWFE